MKNVLVYFYWRKKRKVTIEVKWSFTLTIRLMLSPPKTPIPPWQHDVFKKTILNFFIPNLSNFMKKSGISRNGNAAFFYSIPSWIHNQDKDQAYMNLAMQYWMTTKPPILWHIRKYAINHSWPPMQISPIPPYNAHIWWPWWEWSFGNIRIPWLSVRQEGPLFLF